jgi:hypothetical protein
MNGLGDKAKEVAIEHVKQKAARDILNGIKDWRSNRISTAKRRWLFELIQNAADTAKARQKDNLRIEINQSKNNITFKHNGGYFTLDEISAVIYGGSTKPYTPDSEYIGKFGTGFLVTHIVSRLVEVKGFVKENERQIYTFEMKINRESNDEDGISQSIEECFSQLNKSCLFNSNDRELCTEFVYQLNDDLSREAAEAGINELTMNLPYVFAFNDIIQEIEINKEKFKSQRKKSEDEESGSITVIDIKSDQNRLPTIFVKKDKDNEVAVSIAVNGNKIITLEKLPRIYVGMPLIETADYVFIPLIINSSKFEPTKERDALDSQSEINKKLLSRAFELYKELLQQISDKNIDSLFRTVDIRLISDERITQNPLWKNFNQNICQTFADIINEIPLVRTVEGKKKIIDTVFPDDKFNGKPLNGDIFKKFYELVTVIKKNIPIKEEVEPWLDSAKRLKETENLSGNVSIYTLKDMRDELVEFVKQQKSFPTFEIFNEKYGLTNSKQFLLSFVEILNEVYKQNEVSSEFINYLLPDQGGVIGPLKWDNGQLHIDKNIPDDVKDIIQKIGWEIRQELLDNDFAKYEVSRDFIRSELNIDNALDKLIKSDELKPSENKIKKEEEWDDNIWGWVELFRWCIKNGKIQKDFPVIVKERKIKNIGELEEESFIIPFKYMDIDEKYEEIFPETRIMHFKYFENENSQDMIESLKKYKLFVTKLPLYKNNLTLGYNKLESILKEKTGQLSKIDHSMEVEETNVSSMPFFEQEVEGRISQSQERGKLLFRFIVEYIINHDDSWEKTIQVNCECKEKVHKIIPSHWLASLKSDDWVPYRTKEDGEEKIVKREATKESIENLLTAEELNELIKNNPDKVIKFLPHFGFDELDLTIKLHSIETGKLEKEIRQEVSVLVDITDIVPDLSQIVKDYPNKFREAIEKLKERLEKEPLKAENKRIGENLEKIVEKIFEDKDFTVRPIYIGGDLEIWPEDIEGWDSGLIEINPYLVEVKFTSGSRVHLSKAQSEKARDKKEYYIVLVVENAGNLRENLLQMGVSSISDDIISCVVDNSHIIEGIHTKLGDFPNPEEVEPDINGYWVKRKLWIRDRNDITIWVAQEFGDGI